MRTDYFSGTFSGKVKAVFNGLPKPKDPVQAPKWSGGDGRATSRQQLIDYIKIKVV